jgi:hypothetical protein
MSAKINPHFFHGFYSNFSYKPNLIKDGRPKELFGSYPIHIKRAIMGGQSEPNDNSNEKPNIFLNEESAFKWYKKTQYSKSLFNKLNFPDDFCKNYFIIPESDFDKYIGYFHGMIKSYLVKFNLAMSYEGSSEDLNDCKCESSSSSSRPRSSSSANAFRLLDNQLLSLSILELLEDMEPELINLNDFLEQKNREDNIRRLSDNNIKLLQTNTEDCCYCPPCSLSEAEKSKYNCKFDFKAKVNLNIECDSKKIFEIGELEKRLDGIHIQRKFTPSYKDDEKTIDSLKTYELNKDIYKDNWKLNSNWKTDIFKNGNTNKFPENATNINDPVLMFQKSTDNYGADFTSNTVNPYFNIYAGIKENPSDTKEIIEKQKIEKKSDNLGKFSIKIEATNAFFRDFAVNFYFRVSSIAYIKSEKKFMCFFEIDATLLDSTDFLYKRYNDKEDLSSFFIPNYQNINPLRLITTDDTVKIDKKDEKHFLCFKNNEFMGLKLIKEKLNFKIDGKNCEIEIYTPEKKEIFFKATKTLYSRTGCENKEVSKNCKTFDIKKKWDFKTPIIEFYSWKEDFSKSNVFPPKIS